MPEVTTRRYRGISTVTSFIERPQLHEGRINGGLFVINPKFLDLIEDDQTLLERSPMETAASLGQLEVFRHDGFWQCMDSKRDRESLEKLWADGPPWHH